MAQILIIYTTLRGKTGTMVEPVAEGMRAEGVEARIMQPPGNVRNRLPLAGWETRGIGCVFQRWYPSFADPPWSKRCCMWRWQPTF